MGLEQAGIIIGIVVSALTITGVFFRFTWRFFSYPLRAWIIEAGRELNQPIEQSLEGVRVDFKDIIHRLDYHLPNTDVPRIFMEVAQIKSMVELNKALIDEKMGALTEEIDELDVRCYHELKDVEKSLRNLPE